MRTFVVLALAAAAGWWDYKRFGAEGRARFDRRRQRATKNRQALAAVKVPPSA